MSNESPKKPYLNTFTSVSAFELFEAFRKNALTSKNEYAVYGFLYHNMRKDGFLHPISHINFMFFLSQEYNSNILNKGSNTFNISFSKKNIELYADLKEKIFG